MAIPTAIVLGLLIMISAVHGQELRHPPSSVPDPYHGWKDQAGRLCCNRRDCVAATPCRVEGRDGWIERGQCWVLPLDRELTPPFAVWEYGDLHVCREWGPVPGGSPRVLCWAMARGT